MEYCEGGKNKQTKSIRELLCFDVEEGKVQNTRIMIALM